jgi:copper chaperone NosL
VREVERQPCRMVILLVVCLLLDACAKQDTKPVEITPEDMCAFCRMAISEKRFAAEFITRDGDALKFDDIGCMVDYLMAKQDPQRVVAYFVADFETREWVQGEAAFYVRSAEFKTPMSHGIAAFKEQGRAAAEANKYQGRPMRFSELAVK